MKPLSQLFKDWSDVRKSYEELAKDSPRIAGDTAVKILKDNFTKGGLDGGAQKWQERSSITNKSYDRMKGSVYNSKNPVLLQTGNLRDSIRKLVQGKQVRIGVNLSTIPYAKALQEGNSSTHLPKRKYLAYSKQMGVSINRELEKRRLKILKKFKK
jgi:phage gpG-like protein